MRAVFQKGTFMPEPTIAGLTPAAVDGHAMPHCTWAAVTVVATDVVMPVVPLNAVTVVPAGMLHDAASGPLTQLIAQPTQGGLAAAVAARVNAVVPALVPVCPKDDVNIIACPVNTWKRSGPLPKSVTAPPPSIYAGWVTTAWAFASLDGSAAATNASAATSAATAYFRKAW